VSSHDPAGLRAGRFARAVGRRRHRRELGYPQPTMGVEYRYG